MQPFCFRVPDYLHGINVCVGEMWEFITKFADFLVPTCH